MRFWLNEEDEELLLLVWYTRLFLVTWQFWNIDYVLNLNLNIFVHEQGFFFFFAGAPLSVVVLFFLLLDARLRKNPPEAGEEEAEAALKPWPLTVPLDFDAGEEMEPAEAEGMQRDWRDVHLQRHKKDAVTEEGKINSIKLNHGKKK